MIDDVLAMHNNSFLDYSRVFPKWILSNFLRELDDLKVERTSLTLHNLHKPLLLLLYHGEHPQLLLKLAEREALAKVLLLQPSLS